MKEYFLNVSITDLEYLEMNGQSVAVGRDADGNFVQINITVLG